MNNKTSGLRTAIYKVGDITAAKEWYTKVFDTLPYFDEPFYVGFNIGGYELGLQPEEQPTTGKIESVVAYWHADDVHTECAKFLSSGALEHQKPQDVGGGIITATVKDPWGNIIGLIYNPHFKMSS